MAHKHNRRRVRPRSHNHKSLIPTFRILENPSIPSDSPTFLPIGSLTAGSNQPLQRVTLRSSGASVASRYWYNRCVAWQNREAAKLEAEQIKLFGGEPGDDVGLCYKMMETFEGMDWIDALDEGGNSFDTTNTTSTTDCKTTLRSTI